MTIKDEIIIASHNSGKILELKSLLQPYFPRIQSSKELNLISPIESGKSFKENAEIKSLSAAKESKIISISDDSGLVIDALNGMPGIYSARWAGANKNFDLAMKKVENELQKSNAILPNQRTSHFVCALSMAWPDGNLITVEGKVYGTIVWPPKGKNGFGYDPIFLPHGYSVTFGEMEVKKKDRISHRSLAFQKLLRKIL